MYVCVELKAEKELFVWLFFETSFSVALEPALQKELLNVSAYRLKTGILSINFVAIFLYCTVSMDRNQTAMQGEGVHEAG